VIQLDGSSEIGDGLILLLDKDGEWGRWAKPATSRIRLADVAANEQTYVTAGTRSGATADDRFSLEVLSSTDGTTWENRSSVPDVSATGVASGDAGFIVFGQSNDDHTVVLYSIDGIEWSSPTAIDGMVQGVTRGPTMWIAVGTLDQDAAVWTSIVGAAWDAAIVDDPASGRAGGLVIADRVFVGAWGHVAVGVDRQCDGDFENCAINVAWRSVDGRLWSRQRDDPISAFGNRITLLDANTLFGLDDSGRGYVSRDGAPEWTRLDAAVPDPDLAVLDVASQGGSVVVVGFHHVKTRAPSYAALFGGEFD
jgi:hypothetical protein